MKHRLESYFMNFAAMAFFVMAGFSLLTAANPATALNGLDGFFGISQRWILFFCGGLELFTSAFLLLNQSSGERLAMIAWMAVNLLAYRLELLWEGDFNAGDCVGNLYDWLGLPPGVMFALSSGMLGGLVVGTTFFLILRGWNRGLAKRKTTT